LKGTKDPPVDAPRYALTLFITGATPRSVSAVENVQAFCGRELEGRYELEIVDLYMNPDRAQPANVIVAPTLIRHEPKPVKLLVGDMSDTRRLQTTIVV
jgi:circadian clock protein KaiB